MTLQLVHAHAENQHEAQDGAVEVHYAGATLCRYVYQPATAAIESPRPYLHPVRTLAGNLVTGFRPPDHAWHHGISMTCAHLRLADGHVANFWGGPTYVRDQGYIQLDNNGRIQHQSWQLLDCDGARVTLRESLQWLTNDGQPWLAEQREIEVRDVNPSAGYWVARLRFKLTNIAGQPLAFGSPTTAGRPAAGYGGLFWRGPGSFVGGKILAAGGLEGPDVMGRRAPWLACIGLRDSSAPPSTLVFVDDPANPRYPNQWFVRGDSYAGTSFALAFDQEYVLDAGADLDLRYRILVADGEWPRERIEHLASL